MAFLSLTSHAKGSNTSVQNTSTFLSNSSILPLNWVQPLYCEHTNYGLVNGKIMARECFEAGLHTCVESLCCNALISTILSSAIRPYNCDAWTGMSGIVEKVKRVSCRFA